jgi:hypothetical protein
LGRLWWTNVHHSVDPSEQQLRAWFCPVRFLCPHLGLFKEVNISEVRGKNSLNPRNERRFRMLVELLREDIVRKWVDFFVYNKVVKFVVISKKID